MKVIVGVLFMFNWDKFVLVSIESKPIAREWKYLIYQR